MSDQFYNLPPGVLRGPWHARDKMLRPRFNEVAIAQVAKYIFKTDTDTSSVQMGSTESEHPDSFLPTEHHSSHSTQSTTAETIISQTDSTGVQSQRGGTWQHSMTYTANSGFACGIHERWDGKACEREEKKNQD